MQKRTAGGPCNFRSTRQSANYNCGKVLLFIASGLLVSLGPIAQAQEAATARPDRTDVSAGTPDVTAEDLAITASARNLSRAFNRASDRAMPATVKILSRSKSAGEEDPILSIIGGEDEQVFDSVGSGVIITSDGQILTNHHVIKDASRIEVRLTDGRRFEVTDTKSDPRSDVAIIKITAEDELPVAELGESDALYVGQWVLAIGSPFMLESSVSAGIISGTRRYRTLSRNVSGQFLQTDAAINPGNSGGPLIDLEGRVIGINTAISSRSGTWQGIGFAIPIKRAKWIRQELLDYGKVRRAYIGVRTSDVSFQLARARGLPSAGGAMVNSVVPDRPAQKAGLKSGDVIIEFDETIVQSAKDFSALIQQSQIDTPLPIIIIRDGERMELEVVLQEP